MRAERACPLCDAPAAITVGAPFVGTVGLLWGRRAFEERLYRCAEGHVYSVRVERQRRGERITAEPHGSVDEWLRARTGREPLERPPGL
jgi:hypothetical protein